MRTGIMVTAALAAAGFGSLVDAANLVGNPDFDMDTSGWTSPAPVFELNELDGIPDAPSLHVVSGTVQGSGYAVTSCITVDPSTNYDFRAFSRVDAGVAVMGALEFSDASCTSLVSVTPTDMIAADGRWHDFEINDYQLPPNTQSVQLVAQVDPTDAGVLGDALFDHVRFGRTGTLDADDSINLAQEGLSGTWYDYEVSGQGFEFSFTTTHQQGVGTPIFGAWFTYDLPSNDAAAQRWYSMQGSAELGQTSADVTIYRNVGGNFDAPPSTSATPVGTGTITFFSCSSGLFRYSLDDGRAGIVPLHNLLTQAECTETPPSGGVNPNDFGLSGIYYDPSKSGQGLMIEVDPTGTVFLGWYTYAINGSTAAESQRWLSAQGGWTEGGDSTELDIYVSTGGGFAAGDSLGALRVGSGVLTFTSCSAVTFDYAITEGEFAGKSGTMNLVRLGAELESCPFPQ